MAISTMLVVAGGLALTAASLLRKGEGAGPSRPPGPKEPITAQDLDSNLSPYWRDVVLVHLQADTDPVQLDTLAGLLEALGAPRARDMLHAKAEMIRAAWKRREPVRGWTYDAQGNPVRDPSYQQPAMPQPNGPTGGPPVGPPAPVSPDSIGLPKGGWIDAAGRVHYVLQPGQVTAEHIAAAWGRSGFGGEVRALNPTFPWGHAYAGTDMLIPETWWTGPRVPTTRPAGMTTGGSGAGGKTPGTGGGGAGKGGIQSTKDDPWAVPPGFKPPPGMPPAYDPKKPQGEQPYTPKTGWGWDDIFGGFGSDSETTGGGGEVLQPGLGGLGEGTGAGPSGQPSGERSGGSPGTGSSGDGGGGGIFGGLFGSLLGGN